MQSTLGNFADVDGLSDRARSLREGEKGSEDNGLHLVWSLAGVVMSNDCLLESYLAIRRRCIMFRRMRWNLLLLSMLTPTTMVGRTRIPGHRGNEEYEDEEVVTDHIGQLALTRSFALAGLDGHWQWNQFAVPGCGLRGAVGKRASCLRSEPLTAMWTIPTNTNLVKESSCLESCQGYALWRTTAAR